MKTKQDSLFIYKSLTLVMLILLVAASGGLSVVWLRQQTSKSATHIQTREQELAHFERRLQYLEAKTALVHQPEYLKRRVQRLGLKLAPARQQQIVLLSSRFHPTGSGPLDAEPFIISYDLAFLEFSPSDAAQ